MMNILVEIETPSAVPDVGLVDTASGSENERAGVEGESAGRRRALEGAGQCVERTREIRGRDRDTARGSVACAGRGASGGARHGPAQNPGPRVGRESRLAALASRSPGD